MITSTIEQPDLPAEWAAARAGDKPAVARLVERYHWLALKIARSKRVPPHFEREELVSWANAGLFDAVRKFDPDSGDGSLHEHFIGYATIRIGGSILDGMKSPQASWATRAEWRRVKRMREAEEALQQDLGRAPSRIEVAQRLGLEVSELPILQQQIVLDDPLGDERESGLAMIPSADCTEDSAEVTEIARRIAEKIMELPERLQGVLGVVFYRGIDIKDAPAALGLPAGRARRLRAESILGLRDQLQRG